MDCGGSDVIAGFLASWTIGRATGLGSTAALAAAVLWPFSAAVKSVETVYLVCLAIAGFCGASILWITALDLLFHRRRGGRVRAVRIFDVALALGLTLPALLVLPPALR